MPSERDYQETAERFRPVFARIGVDALDRERAEARADIQLDWLIEAGFARLRVPADLGGDDVPLSWVMRLIAELAEVDPNLAHIWRNHFSFGEDRRHDRSDPRTDDWLRRLGDGEIVGGGWSEPGASAGGQPQTRIRVDAEGRWRLSGTKYYATGSIYARWTTVLALDPDGEKVVVLVATTADGVQVGDDWDAFGQRVTGSGSVRYDDVLVDRANVFSYATRYDYQGHFYQSVLNALLVGINRAVLAEGAAAVRARRRSHPDATTPVPAEDPQLLEVLGRVSTAVYASDAAFERSLAAVDAVVDGEGRGDGRALERAWTSVAQTQAIVIDHVLDSATRVFDALGSSGTSLGLSLDRHWRNARTLASHNPRVYRLRAVGERALADSAEADGV
ncbi:acyl-CoA dehydrogenase family protein [Mycetocola reblochoni]|uniref:Acyl-CoA dehydrogenase n=2 Tax=Mycetocola reblochoni TaxID=331618 RepID=A0A3L6ZKQ6_9MICO|nr:acyl-CoA dehydrogenase family protein [Mycetocola reblochoni]RLP68438.1 acyl-CoA dehydrogenase [Mycetocola reblochoni]SJN35877.1 Acyl-CoA dehydrogenase; probable dibenzothiophene desulfurization enzyme [Mycetocola reblochoni REB411]